MADSNSISWLELGMFVFLVALVCDLASRIGRVVYKATLGRYLKRKWGFDE